MIRKYLPLVFVCLVSFAAAAGNVDVRLESRMSLLNTGFKVERLSFAVDGSFNDKFSVSFFHHLNKTIEKDDVLSATDWVYIKFTPNESWAFKFGKIPLAVGSWEFDKAPINIYFYSDYIDVYKAFQPGFSAQFNFPNGKDALEFQATRSPLAEQSHFDRFGFHLMWKGNHGPFNFIWSANMEKYDAANRFSVCLGNKITLSRFSAYLDLIGGHYPVFDGGKMNVLSVCTRADFLLFDWMSVGAKFSYEDQMGLYRNYRYGGGLEFFPIKKDRDFRLHLQAYNFRADNEDKFIGSVGVKWNFHIYRK